MSSTWCLDPTLFIRDPDGSTNRQKSDLSTHFRVPYHPSEKGIAQTRENIQSTLKGHDIIKDINLAPSFEYIVIGKCS